MSKAKEQVIDDSMLDPSFVYIVKTKGGVEAYSTLFTLQSMTGSLKYDLKVPAEGYKSKARLDDNGNIIYCDTLEEAQRKKYNQITTEYEMRCKNVYPCGEEERNTFAIQRKGSQDIFSLQDSPEASFVEALASSRGITSLEMAEIIKSRYIEQDNILANLLGTYKTLVNKVYSLTNVNDIGDITWPGGE